VEVGWEGVNWMWLRRGTSGEFCEEGNERFVSIKVR